MLKLFIFQENETYLQVLNYMEHVDIVRYFIGSRYKNLVLMKEGIQKKV